MKQEIINKSPGKKYFWRVDKKMQSRKHTMWFIKSEP